MNLSHTPAEGDFVPDVSESSVLLPGLPFIMQSEMPDVASVQLEREDQSVWS